MQPLKSAFKPNAVDVAVDTGFNKSLVLLTFPNPTIAAVIPFTVPVNVGFDVGAFANNNSDKSEPFNVIAGVVIRFKTVKFPSWLNVIWYGPAIASELAGV